MVFGISYLKYVQRLAVCLALTLAAQAAFAASAFTPQHRLGYTQGDQWEPALAADSHGHIYILFPQYGSIPACPSCTTPTMALLTSDDNGITWQPPQVILTSTSGQFDAQVKVDPVDGQTLYVSWMQGRHEVIVGRSQDFGKSWYFAVAEHSPESLIDKPVLAVRGASIYVSFNRNQILSIAASHDYAQNFSTTIVNPDEAPGWTLAAGATVDTANNVYFSWTAYPRKDLVTQPVSVYVSRSADGGKNWITTLLDVSSAAPNCSAQVCSAGFLSSQMALASDDSGTVYAVWNAGSIAGAGRNGFIFRLQRMGAGTGRPRLKSRTRQPVQSIASPPWPPGSAGDVRIAWMDTRIKDEEGHPLWNTFYRASTNGGATWSPESQLSSPVRGYDYIRSSGFLFPFGNLFSLGIDNLGITHAVWGEGQNYQAPGSIWYSRGR